LQTPNKAYICKDVFYSTDMHAFVRETLINRSPMHPAHVPDALPCMHTAAVCMHGKASGCVERHSLHASLGPQHRLANQLAYTRTHRNKAGLQKTSWSG
jgi:hypothetical protein